MAREAAMTYGQVAAIADAMKLAGNKPTSRAVRERLGNIGSLGTINKLLQEWKASQERQMAHALSLPASLQRAILDFLDQELTSAKATLEAELAEQRQEAADLATENERQAAEIENKNENIASLMDKTSTLTGRLDQLSTDLSASKAECERERTSAESTRTELAKAQLRLEAMPRLGKDLDEVRIQLEQERVARVAAEQLSAVQAAKLDGGMKRTEKAESSVTHLTSKIDALQNKIQQQAEELGAARRDARMAIEQKADLRSERSEENKR